MVKIKNYAETPTPCAFNLSSKPLQTSSNPPVTSAQTPAASLLLHLASQSPSSIHRLAFSTASSSCFQSAQASRATRSLRFAAIEDCRAMCKESERNASCDTRESVREWRLDSSARGCGEGRGMRSRRGRRRSEVSSAGRYAEFIDKERSRRVLA